MDKKQFDAEVAIMTARHKAERNELLKKCAMANNTVKIGDIVTDGIDTILVERINTQYFNGDLPYCHYSGILVKKDLTPRKDKTISAVSQRSTMFKILSTLVGEK